MADRYFRKSDKVIRLEMWGRMSMRNVAIVQKGDTEVAVELPKNIAQAGVPVRKSPGEYLTADSNLLEQFVAEHNLIAVGMPKKADGRPSRVRYATVEYMQANGGWAVEKPATPVAGMTRVFVRTPGKPAFH